MAALCLPRASCRTCGLASFMKSMKAFRGFFTSGLLQARDTGSQRERDSGTVPLTLHKLT